VKNTLQKSEILRGYSVFNDIFKDGESLKKGGIKIIYQIISQPDKFPIKVGFTISRNLKKKIIRNRIKRVLKEFYRLNKKELYINLFKYQKSLKFILAYNDPDINLEKINLNLFSKDLSFLFNKIITKIRNYQ
jgi:ribonuclease P protein component